jgi:hypothetical protein
MIDKISAGSVHSWTLASAAVVFLLVGSALAQGKQPNAVAGLKAVNAGETYEVTVNSSEPFLRSDLPVLKIGNQEITISRAPDDGSSDSRIFIVDAEQFRKIKSGDKVVFQWGRGEGRKQLDFGTLDKTRLQK